MRKEKGCCCHGLTVHWHNLGLIPKSVFFTTRKLYYLMGHWCFLQFLNNWSIFFLDKNLLWALKKLVILGKFKTTQACVSAKFSIIFLSHLDMTIFSSRVIFSHKRWYWNPQSCCEWNYEQMGWSHWVDSEWARAQISMRKCSMNSCEEDAHHCGACPQGQAKAIQQVNVQTTRGDLCGGSHALFFWVALTKSTAIVLI